MMTDQQKLEIVSLRNPLLMKKLLPGGTQYCPRNLKMACA